MRNLISQRQLVVLVSMACLCAVGANQKPMPPAWRIVKVERSNIAMKLEGQKPVRVISPKNDFLHVYVTGSSAFSAELRDKESKLASKSIFVEAKGVGARLIYFEGEFPRLEDLSLRIADQQLPLVAPKGKAKGKLE